MAWVQVPGDVLVVFKEATCGFCVVVVVAVAVVVVAVAAVVVVAVAAVVAVVAVVVPKNQKIGQSIIHEYYRRRRAKQSYRKHCTDAIKKDNTHLNWWSILSCYLCLYSWKLWD